MWRIILALMGTAVINVQAKRDFVIEIHEFRFNATTPNCLKTLKYKLIQQKYITVEFALTRKVSEIELRYKFDMIKKDNKHINLLSINIDGCKALESAYTLPLIAAIMKEIARKGNLPKRCPAQSDELFYLRNYTFNEEDYPPVTPPMSFQAFTEFYFEKQYQGYLMLKGKVRKR